MQQGPELLHVILNWCTRKKESIATVEAQEDLPSRAVGRFYGLCLIKDHVLPFDLLEVLSVHDHELVRCDENMKLGVLVIGDVFPVPKFSKYFAVLRATPVWQDLECGYESRDFLLPIVKRRRWSDD